MPPGYDYSSTSTLQNKVQMRWYMFGRQNVEKTRGDVHTSPYVGEVKRNEREERVVHAHRSLLNKKRKVVNHNFMITERKCPKSGDTIRLDN